MTIEHTIEYQKNNEWKWVDVEFEGTPEWQDDSFDYAGTHCTGGRSGTHHIPKYLSMQDSEITWNADALTDAENMIVKEWLALEKNYDEIAEKLCEKYSDQY